MMSNRRNDIRDNMCDGGKKSRINNDRYSVVLKPRLTYIGKALISALRSLQNSQR